MNFNAFKKQLIFIATILLSSCFCNAQSPDLPKIVQPSPEMAALFKFQDYPMDYSTGLPQINVPLYTIQSGSLTLPISISYHASGRKVTDQDGPVAVGWSLNAGGAVSRTIYGAADFGTFTTGTYNFPYPFVVDNLDITSDLEYLEKIIHYSINNDYGSFTVQPWLDGEYDVFSYSAGDISGKFIFKDVNGVKSPVLMPYKPYKIVPTYTVTGLSKINITDDKGVMYEFIAGETYSANSNSATSSWVLSKITSADLKDVISFKYVAGSEERITVSQTATLIDNWYVAPGQFPAINPDYQETTSTEYYSISRISEIEFNNGRVLFNLLPGTYRIDNIQIRDKSDAVLKTIKFNTSICYSQSELGTATNKLDAIVFKDKTGAGAEKYAFEYYPVISSNGQINPRYCDWWGYYNNSGVHDFVPRYTGLYYIGTGGPGNIDIGNPSANREPSLEPLKSGILKKIIYPAGGSTEFIYEKNRCTLYGGTVTPRDGPGLRLYQQIAKDNNGGNIIKTFKYGANESGYGAIELLPEMSNMASETTIGYVDGGASCFFPSMAGKFRQRLFFSGFTGEMSELANRPIIYTQVTEYMGTLTNNTGKTVYTYDINSWGAAGLPNGQSLQITKKHIYNFNYWDNPSLVNMSVYKRDPVTQTGYTKVKEITNIYNRQGTEVVRGLHVQRVYSVPQVGFCTDGYHAEEYVVHSGWGNPFGIVPTPLYAFGSYQIVAGYKNLASTIESTFTDNGNSIGTVKSYEYNGYQLLNKITESVNNGAEKITVIKYPFDYSGNPTLTQMINLNMLAYPVEQIETKGTIALESTRTNYFNWRTSPPLIAPQTIDYKIGNNPYETRIKYYAYDDNGNPLSVSKENDSKVSYLWGYNKSRPIAESKNGLFNELFFDSFEEGNNWGTNVIYSSDNIRTGKLAGKIDKQTTGELFANSINSLNISITSPTKFRYSGWIFSNGPTSDIYLLMKRAGETGSFTYSDVISTNETNKWVFIEKDFSVPADVTNISLRIDNNGGGTVWFDDLRLHRSNAFVTTYTYDPLVGMTSQTDINNKTSFYEYDNYGRLKLIKNFNGEIMRTFKYQLMNTQ